MPQTTIDIYFVAEINSMLDIHGRIESKNRRQNFQRQR